MNFIDLIVGARPNFIKISSIIKSFDKHDIKYRLIHTGQHYDNSMSDNFFDDLNLPRPDIYLKSKTGSQSIQTSSIMCNYEKILKNKAKPSITLVVGDVNSTIACAIVAKKNLISVAHVEAGIRSYDMTMPEEVNRILTDSISDLLFTTTLNAKKYLIKNGHNKDNVFFVGNTMIDTLILYKNKLKQPKIWETENLKKNKYYILTLHRPANVDKKNELDDAINTIINMTRDQYKIIFPIHPRIRRNVEKTNYSNRLIKSDPMSYLEFIYLLNNCNCVITDSGGISEESSILNVPCLTMRENTERPETISRGTNKLVGNDYKKLKKYISKIENNQWKSTKKFKYWDGFAGDRIAKIIKNKID